MNIYDKLCPAFLVLFLCSCASSAPPPRPLDLPFSKIFVGDYDTVWGAVVSVLDIYSIAKARRESGHLETEWSKSRFNTDLYDHPIREKYLEEIKYRLKVKLAKGRVADSKQTAIRVQISKELSQYKDFVNGWVRIPTDHLEEKVLLYRIGQRVKIEKRLKRLKAQNK